MRLKLDENLGGIAELPLRNAGHDVSSVHLQGLGGAPDTEVLRVCQSEGRALVTLDLDFADPIRFPPQDRAGIVVFRLPRRTTPAHLRDAVQVFITALEHRSLVGRLWVINRGRLREYASPNDSPTTE